MWVEGWISFKQTCFWILHIWIELLGKQPMGKRAQNKLNNPAALCVFMLGDSGWEAQRPFQNSRKDWLQRMPGMLRNPSLVCQRQQEADARRDRPSRMSFKEKKKRTECYVIHCGETEDLHLEQFSLTTKYNNNGVWVRIIWHVVASHYWSQ